MTINFMSGTKWLIWESTCNPTGRKIQGRGSSMLVEKGKDKVKMTFLWYKLFSKYYFKIHKNCDDKDDMKTHRRQQNRGNVATSRINTVKYPKYNFLPHVDSQLGFSVLDKKKRQASKQATKLTWKLTKIGGISVFVKLHLKEWKKKNLFHQTTIKQEINF